MEKVLKLFCVVFAGALLVAGCVKEPRMTQTETLSKEPSLFDEGNTGIVDYLKYGDFYGVDTSDYKYIIKDKAGLASAVGEGIYPNENITNNPHYQKLKDAGRLGDDPWKHVNSGDAWADFFVWAALENMEPGTKLFFTAEALKEAGLYQHALKAYYAIIIHYPGSACWSACHSYVWYVAKIALDRIDIIGRKIGITLEGASIDILNDEDTDLKNDVVTVNPGKFIRFKKKKVNLNELEIVQTRGSGKVRLVQFSNGHWQMLVDGKPFIVKGITYSPSKVGESYYFGTVRNWMFMDDDGNGRIDAPYDSWVDENRNNKKDKNEKITGDFQLLKEMGINAIRHYHVPPGNKYSTDEWNKEILRDLYKNYGIRVIMGDFLGAYTIGSGAHWNMGTDYQDKTQREKMKEIVRQMVIDHKDEPYVLMWLLGNENNMDAAYTGINAARTLATIQPEAYAKFLNEVAEMIHSIDGNYPVAVGNVGLGLVEYYKKYAPAIDILGINSYPGKDGFGLLWRRTKKLFDRPVLIPEYGSDAFNVNLMQEDEKSQAEYHRGNWDDIRYNFAGGGGEGNAIGGVIFSWLDEWWKSHQGTPDTQQKTKDCAMAFQDGWSSEEWLGIVSQGDGSDSPFLRQLRPAYYMYKELWNK